MDRLTEMEAFVRVVDHSGFTEAAKKMGLSKSAISKHVTSLETRLGVRLLNRTTRRVSPTEIGLAYYDRANGVLRDADEANEMVTAMQSEPRGALRISAPVSFGIRHLSPIVADFLSEYSSVSVNLVFDDRFVEVVADGFDLAIRIGQLADSSLRVRKLGETRLSLVASQDYLERYGTPTSIDDLNDHNLLHYSNLSTGNFWRLSAGHAERLIRVGGRLSANNGDALLAAALKGLGVALVPGFILSEPDTHPSLRRILPEYTPDSVGIYAVYPAGPFPQPKLRVFVDYLAQQLRAQNLDSSSSLPVA